MTFMTKGPKEIKAYYQDNEVVQQYLKKRFVMPLRQIQHESQVEFVNNMIKDLKPTARILEVSLGPGRLTTEIDVSNSCKRFALDYSLQMLRVAVERLCEQGCYKYWNLINSDAFMLPFKENSFDLIYSFRLIRHFEIKNREKIYSEMDRVLKDNGVLIFDAQNYNISYPHRVKEGLEDYPVYDVLYKREELIGELQSQGWEVHLQGVMCRFNLQEFIQKALIKLHANYNVIKKFLLLLENGNDKNPSEWIVLCRKR